MAAGSQYFTASHVGDLVTGEGENDHEFLFPGSDDDFDDKVHIDSTASLSCFKAENRVYAETWNR